MKKRSFKYKDHKGQGGDFEVLPTGRYTVFIIDNKDTNYVKRTVTQKSGKEFLALTMMIATGPHKGKLIFDNMFLNDKALWRLVELYESVEPMEQDRSDEWDLNNDDDIHRELFYKVFQVDTKHEVYNGKTYLNVDKFLAIEDETEYNEAFDAASELVKTGKAGQGPRQFDDHDPETDGGSPEPSSQQGPPSPPDDDDVPF